jgi:hypothetical protein
MASAFPWTTSASGWRSGCSVDLRTHGEVCDLATEGRRPVDLGVKVIDMPAPRGIDSTQHTDPVTQVDGPVMTDVLLHSVSAVDFGGGDGTQSVLEAQNPSK